MLGIVAFDGGFGKPADCIGQGPAGRLVSFRFYRLYDDHRRRIPPDVYRRGIPNQKSGGESSGFSPSQLHFRVYHHVQRISGSFRNARSFAFVCSKPDGLQCHISRFGAGPGRICRLSGYAPGRDAHEEGGESQNPSRNRSGSDGHRHVDDVGV